MQINANITHLEIQYFTADSYIIFVITISLPSTSLFMYFLHAKCIQMTLSFKKKLIIILKIHDYDHFAIKIRVNIGVFMQNLFKVT